MSNDGGNFNSDESAIQSGKEIIAEFVSSLKKEEELDRATVEAIDELFADDRLTLTNLLRYLEDARGKTKV